MPPETRVLLIPPGIAGAVWLVLVDLFVCGLLCVGKGSVLKSLGGVSTVLTNIILATSPHSAGTTKDTKKSSNKEDAIVMDTKLKIIDILKVSIS